MQFGCARCLSRSLSKQYEQRLDDLTYHVQDLANTRPPVPGGLALGGDGPFPGDPVAAMATPEAGALILRGCRCVLVRSIEEEEPEWDGMRIPSVPPDEEESLQEAAVRVPACLPAWEP